MWFIFKTLNSYPETEQTTPDLPLTTTADYALSMCEKISTIVVKPNNLIDICTLGKEFEMSFKFYINKLEFNKNILQVFAGRNEKIRFLRVVTHLKVPKIRIIARVDSEVVKSNTRRTPKIKTKTWNTIKIRREQLQNDWVRKEIVLTAN